MQFMSFTRQRPPRPTGGRPRLLQQYLILCMLALPVAANAACDFAAAKKEIDQILDADKEKAAAFRKQMSAGYDSLDVLGKMLGPSAREAVESCRFEAAEYLTKRGFPPAH